MTSKYKMRVLRHIQRSGFLKVFHYQKQVKSIPVFQVHMYGMQYIWFLESKG